MSAFFRIPPQSNLSLKETISSVHSLLLVLIKVTVLMRGNLLHATVQMGVLISKVLNCDRSYSPVAHADSFIINIAVTVMQRLTVSILDVSNVFQNKNVPIHERVCVIPPPYQLDCFERSNPNVPLNLYAGPFCLQCINGIQGKKTDGLQ